MLEEPADDTRDPDAITDAGELRSETADPAYDEIDFDAGLRRAIQRVDHLCVDERIHLPDNAPAPTRRGVLGLTHDQLDEARAHVHRGDEQLTIQTLSRVAGERIE